MDKATGTHLTGLQWAKSIEISWFRIFVIRYKFNPFIDFSLGLGLDWRNYKTTFSKGCMVAESDTKIIWGKFPEGAVGKHSILKVFSLQVPVLVTFSVPKTSLRIKLGPIVDFNTYGSLKNVYENSSRQKVKDYTRIYPNAVTIDGFLDISFKSWIGLYLRYSPLKLLKSESPFNFRPLSVGVSFIL